MSLQISCIVVEDEPLALDRMLKYIGKVPMLTVASTFDNADQALVFLQRSKVDLVFLDINLGEMSGIQLLESMDVKSAVIITTAYPDFAIKGFDLNVADYLLKPFLFDRFQLAVEKAAKFIIQKGPVIDKTFFFVKTENRLEKIFYSDLLFIEGMRDYRKIHTSQKKVMTLQTFGEFEREIPVNILCRVHKSFMVAINKIDSIEKDKIYIQNVVIPISETYKGLFLKTIGL